MDTFNETMEYYHASLDYSMDAYFEKNLGKEPDKKYLEPYIDFLHRCQVEDKTNPYDYDSYHIHYHKSLKGLFKEYKKAKDGEEQLLAAMASLSYKFEDLFQKMSELVPTIKKPTTDDENRMYFHDEKFPKFYFPNGKPFNSFNYSQKTHCYLKALNDISEIEHDFKIINAPSDFNESSDIENLFTTCAGFSISFVLDIVLRFLTEKGEKIDEYKNVLEYSQFWKSRISFFLISDNNYHVLALPDEIVINSNIQIGHKYIPSIIFGEEKYWFVDNVLYPPSFGKSLDELTKEDILYVKNIEMRRTYFEKFGQIELIKKLGAQPFDKDIDEYGNEMILYKTEFDELISDSFYYVQVVCPSTLRVYTIPVPPMNDVRSAVAWTFNKTKEGYSPRIQT